jgi:hypothetical protein
MIHASTVKVGAGSGSEPSSVSVESEDRRSKAEIKSKAPRRITPKRRSRGATAPDNRGGWC